MQPTLFSMLSFLFLNTLAAYEPHNDLHIVGGVSTGSL